MVKLTTPGVKDRAVGCLLGQIAGDNLGGLVEFQTAAEIARRYKTGPSELKDGGTWNLLAGQGTDDSELALLLARSIAFRGHPDPRTAAASYLWWYRGGFSATVPGISYGSGSVYYGHRGLLSKPFDIGGQTASSLSRYTLAGLVTTPRTKTHLAGPSEANGSLMRCSPIGVWAAGRESKVAARAARRDSALTHPSVVCQDACAVFCVAIARAITQSLDPIAIWAYASDWAYSAACEPVRLALRDALHSRPVSYQHHKGHVLTALHNAFFQLCSGASVRDGVVDTVRRGGDTDTNAAICGALLGAVYGADSIPTQWRKAVENCRPDLRPGVAHPRPRVLWPTDYSSLALRVLRSGR